MAQFLQNAVSWLSISPPAPKQCRGVGWGGMQPCSAITSSLGVYCTDAYDDTQMRDLIHFVKKGGRLLTGGQRRPTPANWAVSFPVGS
uniref:Uncharacterized protein n=1 Tax=Terrapene triunguis TaxID=2587831 RepID=A0A674IEK7_9SAUR